LEYSWTCESLNGAQAAAACPNGLLSSLKSSSTTFASSAGSVNTTYRVTLEVSNGAKKAATSIEITVVHKLSENLSVQILSDDRVVDATKELRFDGSVTPYEGTQIGWSVNDNDSTIFLDSDNMLSVIIPAGILENGREYILSLTGTRDGSSLRTDHKFRTKSLLSEGVATLITPTPLKAVESLAELSLTGFSSEDDDLTYQILVNGKAFSPETESNNLRFATPFSNNVVEAHVCDSGGM
jgi:hypothetical protein